MLLDHLFELHVREQGPVERFVEFELHRAGYGAHCELDLHVCGAVCAMRKRTQPVAAYKASVRGWDARARDASVRVLGRSGKRPWATGHGRRKATSHGKTGRGEVLARCLCLVV